MARIGKGPDWPGMERQGWAWNGIHGPDEDGWKRTGEDGRGSGFTARNIQALNGNWQGTDGTARQGIRG